MAKFTATPQLIVDFVATKDNGSKEVMEIREGDILEDVVYMEGGATYSKTGKVAAILASTKKVVPNYNLCPCDMKSNVLEAIEVEAIVLDSSDKFDADASLVYVKNIKSIGSVTTGNVEVSEETIANAGVAAMLASLQPGQDMVLPVCEVAEALEINQSVVIKGVNAGVNAAKGYRAAAEVEGETVLAGAINVADGVSVVLDGLTLTGDAQVTAAGESNIKLVNCRVLGVKEAEGKREGVIKSTSWDNEVLLTIENCYFGDNAETMYNLFELNMTLQSNTTVKNCYFTEKSFKNNAINLYQVAKGAYINVVGNTFEFAGNGVRVGAKGEPECVVNVNNNTYFNTLQPTAVKNEAGLVIIQPYGAATTDFSGVTVNINGTKNESDVEQIWYYTRGSKTENFTAEQLPKVFVDGVRQEVVVPPLPVE